MTVHATNIVDADAQISGVRFDDDAQTASQGIYRGFLKRLLDVALVVLALPFVLPFCLLIAVLIAFEGGSPFYSQERIGRNGRRFRMWKFRSMVPDAEARLAEHLDSCAEARVEWARTQKLKNDPRITRIGSVIRSSSMDELPQLFNVLVGDMSLVGPRPMMVSQQELYPGHAYYRLRPGITGLWQVSARNESEFVDRARFDDMYEATLSLATDVSVLARTAGAVLRATGH